MASAPPAGVCPTLRKLITLVARMPDAPGLSEQGQLIDQLTDLETEARETGAPTHTTETIRSVRLTIRAASLMPKPPGIRGH